MTISVFVISHLAAFDSSTKSAEVNAKGYLQLFQRVEAAVVKEIAQVTEGKPWHRNHERKEAYLYQIRI